MALLLVAINTPLLPQEETEATQWSKHHRSYLEQREAYMKANQERLNIPDESVQKSTYSRDKFEERLLETQFIKTKGGEITPPKKTIVEEIISMDFVQIAYAFNFGKEDFESCGAIPCSFDSNDSYSSSDMALDSTSKINGTDTMRCDTEAVDSQCAVSKTITGNKTYYIQYQLLLPTGFTLGTEGYLSLFSTSDGTADPDAPIYCSLEDYGTFRLTCQGEFGIAYTDTGINISLNDPTRLEFRIKADTSTGDLDIWVDSDIEGSPSFNGTANYNTGSGDITKFTIGGYHPDIVNDIYYDDVIADTAFIGNGVPAPTSYLNSTVKGGVIIKGGVIMGGM